MIRYKFEDIFVSQRTGKRCGDCKLYKSCYWNKPPMKVNPDNTACSNGSFKFKNPQVTERTARDILFQIGRQVEISKIGYEIFKDRVIFMRYDTSDVTIDECNLYIQAMSQYLKFIGNFERQIRDRKVSPYDIYNFTKGIINTKIKVQDTEIMIYADNLEVIDYIKDNIPKQYKIRTITSNDITKDWWKN